MRMVLGGLGLGCAEAQARRLIGHTRLGVSLTMAQAKLAEAGATAQWHDDWGLDDLRDSLRGGHYPIVGVERHPLGYSRAFHAVVLVEITSAAITALDPLDGPEPCRYGMAAFALAWEMAGSEALVIETPPLTL
ncbi:MAG TPA: hypothetical protein VNO70_13690 [Blastocatellia bacterium]|nr:hypothetical protein [Blastocatellia bacterium]